MLTQRFFVLSEFLEKPPGIPPCCPVAPTFPALNLPPESPTSLNISLVKPQVKFHENPTVTAPVDVIVG
jgi:hypothetical protein